MPVAGLDVHKRIVQACVLDEHGKVKYQGRFACTREELTGFARKHLGKDFQVALEATTNTWAVVEVLAPLVGEVVVSNPLRTRAIAEAKVKTDKVDARVLAELLHCGYLPRVWIPDEATRQGRHLSTRRATLVARRTGIKNRLHAVLHQRLIHLDGTRLFSDKGLAYLKRLDLDELGRQAVDSELRLLAAVGAEIEQINALIIQRSCHDERIKLLITLPGVDVTVAQALLSTLGDITRFADGDKAASYLGLAPSTRQSAEHCYHGPITKRGKAHTRWLLVQAAQHLGNHPGPLGAFFRRLASKKNRNVAVIATARKLVVIAWHMLTDNQPYRYAQVRPTERKLQALRVASGAGKRKRGPAKGSKRSQAYGSGKRLRLIPALPTLYSAEGLPSLAPLKAGEHELLQRSAPLRTFHGNLSRSQHLTRKGKR